MCVMLCNKGAGEGASGWMDGDSHSSMQVISKGDGGARRRSKREEVQSGVPTEGRRR